LAFSYTATAELVPRKHRARIGFVVGWLNILGKRASFPAGMAWLTHSIGQVAGASSTEFGLSNMIWAAVVVAKVSAFDEYND
jgi:hypothetical protein